mgnify:FL=1
MEIPFTVKAEGAEVAAKPEKKNEEVKEEE